MLVVRECFDSIDLRENINNQYVHARFIEDDKDQTKGALKLSYWMDATFQSLPAHKYFLN